MEIMMCKLYCKIRNTPTNDSSYLSRNNPKHVAEASDESGPDRHVDEQTVYNNVNKLQILEATEPDKPAAK